MAQYVPTRWVDSETLITADRLNKLENGVKDALPSADAATVAKTGSYNDLNNKPTIPPAYTLPYATSSVLGGVKPLWKIAEATQPVYVDSAGRLYTVPSSSGGGGGGSLSQATKNAILACFDAVAWKDDVSGSVLYDALRDALGESGGDTPDVPTEVTLSYITASYNGGSVPVGTTVDGLSISVKAFYSDGSSEDVSGFSVSGVIGEGSNSVTISYNGKTAVVIVVGYSAPTWEPGVPLSLGNITAGKINQNTGAVESSTTDSYTDLIDISGAYMIATRVASTKLSAGSVKYVYFDADGVYAGARGFYSANNKIACGVVPDGAKYVRLTGGTSNFEGDGLVELLAMRKPTERFVSSYSIDSGNVSAGSIGNDGIQNSASTKTSDYIPVFGATSCNIGTSNSYANVCFYDSEKNFIVKSQSTKQPITNDPVPYTSFGYIRQTDIYTSNLPLTVTME